ncbi:MAG: diguanylate cyclase [Deltaproteobacteria bacterium]|nr:diguanylate cyclase [Deltaproteobacteria bacterium]
MACLLQSPVVMTSLGQQAKQDDRPLPAPKEWNRSHATKRLAEEMGHAKGDAAYQFSILLVEFGGLTDSADRLGYASGQDVWRRAMAFLVQDLNAEDLCCRLSGDEFLLILSGEGLADARNVVERLKQRWQPAAGTREGSIQVNIGIASYPTHGCKIEELLCAADEALHADRLNNEVINSAEVRRTASRRTSH